MRPYYRARYGAHSRARFFFWARLAIAVFAASTGIGVIAAAVAVARAFGLSSAAPIVIPVLMVVACLLAAGVFTSMRRFGSPLWAVMDAADRVAEGDYTVRVKEWGAPPIYALAKSFNRMTARLQDADRVRRDLMADVAHELRTPLTVLQGRIEGLIDGVYPVDAAQLEQLLEQTNVLSRLVEDLRTLALSDAGVLPLQKESTNVIDLVREVARSFAGQHPSISAPDAADVTADIDPVRIREVISNLLANAIRYTPADGRIWIAVDAQGDRIVLTVNDTGRGIAPDQLSRLFDRFYKGADSRGSGLGLAIAKGIVSAHGGDIGATSVAGHGTQIRFTLPR
jgi:signal transduction histidine kinase